MRHRTTVIAIAVLAALGSAVAAVASLSPGEPGTTFAFLARGDDPIDALAAAPVAGRLDAPILLTPTTVLTAAAAQGLADAAPDVVVVAGGPAAISPAVFEEVVALLPDSEVRRVAGADRYLSAEALAALVREYEPAFVYGPLAEVDLSGAAAAPVEVEHTAWCHPFAFDDADGTDYTREEVADEDGQVHVGVHSGGASGGCSPSLPPTAIATALTVIGDEGGANNVPCTFDFADMGAVEVGGPGAPRIASVEVSTGESTDRVKGNIVSTRQLDSPITMEDVALHVTCLNVETSLVGVGVTYRVREVVGPAG